MIESFVCECGSVSFLFLWDRVRCPICNNEYHQVEKYNGHLDPKIEYWMRRYNKKEDRYNEKWERAPETFKNEI